MKKFLVLWFLAALIGRRFLTNYVRLAQANALAGRRLISTPTGSSYHQKSWILTILLITLVLTTIASTTFTVKADVIGQPYVEAFWDQENYTITLKAYTDGNDFDQAFNSGILNYRSSCLEREYRATWTRNPDDTYTLTQYISGDLDRLWIEGVASWHLLQYPSPWHLMEAKGGIERSILYTCPEIASITPTGVAPGLTIHIEGSNLLGNGWDEHRLQFIQKGTIKAELKLWEAQWASTWIDVKIPTTLVEGQDYQVKIYRGTFPSNTVTYHVGYLAPIISSITPSHALPGDRITISGSNFLHGPAGTGASQLQIWIENPSTGGVNWLDAASENVDWDDGQISMSLPKNLQSGQTYLVRVMRNGTTSNVVEYTTGNRKYKRFIPFARFDS